MLPKHKKYLAHHNVVIIDFNGKAYKIEKYYFFELKNYTGNSFNHVYCSSFEGKL